MKIQLAGLVKQETVMHKAQGRVTDWAEVNTAEVSCLHHYFADDS